MATYIIRRTLHTLIVLLGVFILTFTLVHLIPGDPALVILGTDATPEEVARLRGILELDRPLHIQFFNYIGRALQGEFGDSIFQQEPVSKLIIERLPATIELTIAAMFVASLLGILTGVISGTRPYSLYDSLSAMFSLTGVAMPVFWLGLLGILLFSLKLGWLPSFGRGPGFISALAALILSGDSSQLVDSLKHLMLPALTLGAYSTAIISRLVRSSMLEVMGQDYIRTARSKGLQEFVVVNRHALRNALIPVVTVMGLQMGALLGGAVITETIFAWPGLGRMLVNAIFQRDYPLVQALVVVIAFIVSSVNLVVDILYGFLDPRVRHE